MATDNARLSNMEATQLAILSELRRLNDNQDEALAVFYRVMNNVRDMESKTKGAWFVFGLFGTLTVAVSGVVAWVVTIFK